MQDQPSELATQEANVDNQNNEDLKVGEGNEQVESASEEVTSAEGQQGQTGELPDDFKGRLAREKKRHDREKAQLQGQIAQLNQTMQALLSTKQNNTPQNDTQPNVQQEGNDREREVIGIIQKFVDRSNQEKVAQEIAARVNQVKLDMQNAHEVYPDFDEVINDQTLVFPQQLLEQVALSSSNSRDVIYYLCKNRDKLQGVLNTHPALQSGEIARISAELMANAKRGKAPTKAPAPSNALTTNPVVSAGSIKENASVDELRKLLGDIA